MRHELNCIEISGQTLSNSNKQTKRYPAFRYFFSPASKKHSPISCGTRQRPTFYILRLFFTSVQLKFYEKPSYAEGNTANVNESIRDLVISSRYIFVQLLTFIHNKIRHLYHYIISLPSLRFYPVRLPLWLLLFLLLILLLFRHLTHLLRFAFCRHWRKSQSYVAFFR